MSECAVFLRTMSECCGAECAMSECGTFVGTMSERGAQIELQRKNCLR